MEKLRLVNGRPIVVRVVDTPLRHQRNFLWVEDLLQESDEWWMSCSLCPTPELQLRKETSWCGAGAAATFITPHTCRMLIFTVYQHLHQTLRKSDE